MGSPIRKYRPAAGLIVVFVQAASRVAALERARAHSSRAPRRHIRPAARPGDRNEPEARKAATRGPKPGGWLGAQSDWPAEPNLGRRGGGSDQVG